jgi:hypothetical protein
MEYFQLSCRLQIKYEFQINAQVTSIGDLPYLDIFAIVEKDTSEDRTSLGAIVYCLSVN